MYTVLPLWDNFVPIGRNFLLNVKFAYFVYSNQSEGVTSEHWLRDFLFTLHLIYLYE